MNDADYGEPDHGLYDPQERPFGDERDEAYYLRILTRGEPTDQQRIAARMLSAMHGREVVMAENPSMTTETNQQLTAENARLRAVIQRLVDAIDNTWLGDTGEDMYPALAEARNVLEADDG